MKEVLKVLDRNGDKLKTGDCVRIIASECNKVLDANAKEICPLLSSLLRWHEDIYGIADLDGTFKIVDTDGNVLWNTHVSSPAPEPCLEIAQAHIETIGGEKYIVADTIKAALVAWFGEESGEKLVQALKSHKVSEKCVYILEMSNATVKIGVTQDLYRRQNAISTGSGLNIVRWCHTSGLPRNEAYMIENACHKTFRYKRIKGEFFEISFEEAVAELQKYADVVKYS